MDFTQHNFGLLNYPPAIGQLSGSSTHIDSQVTVQLSNKELWKNFNEETTEMIITKLGRRMFPSVQIKIDGLDVNSRYCVFLEISLASERRYKYMGGHGASVNNIEEETNRGWTNSGAAEPQSPIHRRLYLHPDSPATGFQWMRQTVVNFNKLKLTNNVIDHNENIVLTSMHKYVTRIWIVKSSSNDLCLTNDFFSQPSMSFTLNETQFIAVTAYQNENITKLKINNNPFAKGFRLAGQGRCKKKLKNQDNKINNLSSNLEYNENNKRINNFDNERPVKLHRPWIDEKKNLQLLKNCDNYQSQLILNNQKLINQINTKKKKTLLLYKVP
ncbi:T-box transcription factor TBX3-like [Aphidius gifuensis]|uniref:T-box transcription factor TBX3-like n=1 Tax=Aphidius gifuensis TaxID=684658 RepID=UPI001CDC7086|nr:T-box transcription factor TBX3-like [Aphidius gifuensis]